MKNDLKKSLCTYVKRFKAEKAKIVVCDDSIVWSAFQNGLPRDHPLFGELIRGEKHSLWDEKKRSQKSTPFGELNMGEKHSLEQPHKDAKPTQKKVNDKPLDNKSKPGDKRKDHTPVKGGTAPKTYTKFSVPVSQIFRDLNKKSWFKPPPPLKGDTSKMNQTKYCVFHKGAGHTTNYCTIWKRYIEQLVKEGKCDQYVDRPNAPPR
ncbi:hypothetical protein ACFX2K_022274 [Malus domestica]